MRIHIHAHPLASCVCLLFLRAPNELPKEMSKGMLSNENIHHRKLLSKQLHNTHTHTQTHTNSVYTWARTHAPWAQSHVTLVYRPAIHTHPLSLTFCPSLLPATHHNNPDKCCCSSPPYKSTLANILNLSGSCLNPAVSRLSLSSAPALSPCLLTLCVL